jgi:hypothetical protein
MYIKEREMVLMIIKKRYLFTCVYRISNQRSIV